MFSKAPYNFLLNMWIMNRINEQYLDVMIFKGFITEEEKTMITMTSQINR